MRAIKVTIVSLLCLIAVLANANRFSATFKASGQATTLSAPTNVTASDNAYATKVEIEWEAIRGATLYRVFRNTSNDSASAIALGTTTQGSFFDTTAIVGQTYFYWVRAENGSNVGRVSGPDQGTRANGIINGPIQPLNPPPAPPGVISNNSDGTYNLSTVYGFREQVTGRKSRSYIDGGYSNSLFWDGRATQVFTDPIGGAVVLPNGAALESQVLGPPVSSAEMAHAGRTWNDVAVRVTNSKPLALTPFIPNGLRDWIGGRSYPELFEEAFGTPEVTPVRIALAVASFERTLYSDRTPLD